MKWYKVLFVLQLLFATQSFSEDLDLSQKDWDVWLQDTDGNRIAFRQSGFEGISMIEPWYFNAEFALWFSQNNDIHSKPAIYFKTDKAIINSYGVFQTTVKMESGEHLEVNIWFPQIGLENFDLGTISAIKITKKKLFRKDEIIFESNSFDTFAEHQSWYSKSRHLASCKNTQIRWKENTDESDEMIVFESSNPSDASFFKVLGRKFARISADQVRLSLEHEYKVESQLYFQANRYGLYFLSKFNEQECSWDESGRYSVEKWLLKTGFTSEDLD